MNNVNWNWLGKLCITLVLSALLSACKEESTTTDDDNDPANPQVLFNNLQVNEGDTGIVESNFSITLSAASEKPVSLEYSTTDGSATAPTDYQAINGTLSFAPGETEKALTVTVMADTEPESDENFNLNFSGAINATIQTASATITINNDDTPINVEPPVLPSINISNVTITEGNSNTTNADFDVTLSAESTNTVSVDFETGDISATAPKDYQSRSGTVTFAPGETAKTISVAVVADAIAELDETFIMNLSSPANASLAKSSAIATVLNDDTDTSVLLSNPGPKDYDEEQDYTINITARASARIFVSGMPPGMHWDEVQRRFDFRPDFIQGGNSWQITMEAVDGVESATESFTVTVNNTIQPPWPEVVATQDLTGLTKLTVSQITDEFLDSPGHAGREFTANLAIPTAASADNLLPVRIGQHGYGGTPGTVGRAGWFGVAPHDPNNTWWTGYSDQLPDGSANQGTVPNYSQRRVMHLFSYLVEHYPGTDLERVSVSGQSMGGTGSYFLAIRYARHFSQMFSRLGGTTPHLLSDGHQRGLTGHWGSVDLGLPTDLGMNAWQYYDTSRAILNDKDFRNLFFKTVVGQNDTTIHFRNMVGASPVTGVSFIDTLQSEAISHFIVWDQRGHSETEGAPLGAYWWKDLDDDVSERVRNQAFPAFTNCSADDDPGLPDGQGGYTGTLRGALNRYLRWNSADIVDTRDQLSVPIKVDIDTGGTPPEPGYPPKANFYYGSLPVTADVTIRRIQHFQLLPGEAVNWSYNGASGTVYANEDGSVTVPNLEMETAFTALTISRQ